MNFPEPTFDREGYPTEKSLEAIKEFPWDRPVDLMDMVEYMWWNSGTLFVKTKEPGKTVYTLHTGGWSGNEDIIDALKSNSMFWALCWVSSRRGGHFEFEITDKHFGTVNSK